MPIRFAQFVLEAIANNECKFTEGFMSSPYLVNIDRPDDKYFEGYYGPAEEKDEWSLSIGWSWPFVYTAWLYRGKNCYRIDLTRDENKALVKAYKAQEKRAKDQAKAWAAKREEDRKAAAWWP